MSDKSYIPMFPSEMERIYWRALHRLTNSIARDAFENPRQDDWTFYEYERLTRLAKYIGVRRWRRGDTSVHAVAPERQFVLKR